MTFEKVATDAMRGMGFPILDAGKITQSRWESSYDGLHYLLQYSLDNWASHTSNMIAQAMLNVLFQSCGEVKDGDPFLSPTPTPSAAPIGGSTNVDKDCIPQGNPIPPNAAISTNIPSNSKFTTSSGRVYSLSTNDDVMSCYHTYFQLIPDNSPDLSSLEDNPDVKVIVHFYTNSSAPGTFCESNGPTCVLMSRQLPLRINEGFNGLVAIFVPDPASKHYVFTVTVGAHLSQVML